MKPISEQAFVMSADRKEDDHRPRSTEAGRQPVAKLRTVDDSRLAEANPPVVVSGGVDGEVEGGVKVEKEAVATGVPVCHIDEKHCLLPINPQLYPRVYMTRTSSQVGLIPLLRGCP